MAFHVINAPASKQYMQHVRNNVPKLPSFTTLFNRFRLTISFSCDENIKSNFRN